MANVCDTTLGLIDKAQENGPQMMDQFSQGPKIVGTIVDQNK